MPQEKKHPKVFISYSHDSPAHKRWVGEFASKLVKNGIDVILDQWDLGPGNDIVKFMEHSLTSVVRVLMICTESYVIKANEGQGGVGYEAMIVTGELVRDLGTTKFIPIIRQSSEKITLPTSVSTRFYINLSETQNFTEQFDILLRELHQAPAIAKPPLGKNPFSKQPSWIEISPEIKNTLIPNIDELNDNTESIYKVALDVARSGDFVAWRRLIRQAKQPIPSKFMDCRAKYDKSPPKTKDTFPDIVLEAASIYAPLFSIALAGIESGREKFNNQISILDDILNIKDWNYAGVEVLTQLPFTIAYIYQTLHGAMCLATDQIDIAINLACSKVKTKYENSSIPIYQYHSIVGWPPTLDGNCKNGWDFIRILPEKWKWLNEAFGNIDDYLVYRCCYYMALSLLEFVTILSSGKEQMLLEDKHISLNIPLCFLEEIDDIRIKAYKLLLKDPKKIKNIWRKFKIEDKKIQELWPYWIKHSQEWLNGVSKWGFSRKIISKDLITDVLQ